MNFIYKKIYLKSLLLIFRYEVSFEKWPNEILMSNNTAYTKFQYFLTNFYACL